MRICRRCLGVVQQRRRGPAGGDASSAALAAAASQAAGPAQDLQDLPAADDDAGAGRELVLVGGLARLGRVVRRQGHATAAGLGAGAAAIVGAALRKPSAHAQDVAQCQKQRSHHAVATATTTTTATVAT